MKKIVKMGFVNTREEVEEAMCRHNNFLIMINKKYFTYIRYPIIVTKPWDRPNKKKFKLWKKDFLSLKGIENYEVWLHGEFLKNPKNTWDIDIALTGGNDSNILELEKIMVTGTRIGFEKYNMLFDIGYHNKLTSVNEQLSRKRYIDDTIIISNIAIKNGQILYHWKNAKQISKYLWSEGRIRPSPKCCEKILQGYKFADPIKLN